MSEFYQMRPNISKSTIDSSFSPINIKWIVNRLLSNGNNSKMLSDVKIVCKRRQKRFCLCILLLAMCNSECPKENRNQIILASFLLVEFRVIWYYRIYFCFFHVESIERVRTKFTLFFAPEFSSSLPWIE